MSFIPLSIACILSSFHVTASENIIVDNQRKTDLKVGQKYGGEYIDIEKPNEKGISHNYFEKFNVAEEGIIINNIDPVKGHISEVKINFRDKNITLSIGIGEQHAKIIINEVTSPNPSLLKGNLFVMGGVEHLMLVNPYGIVCDGCSVTNASEFTLQSRNKADLVGRGAATDRIYRDDYLDDRIEIKNATQPMNMYGPITLDAYSVDIGDHNGQYGDNKAILAKKVTINSDYLSIYNNVVLNFDQLNLNITGNVFN
ncbi:MAG: filamentous hemagglutinin N-terminal domain-containing protein [Candidatus Arsenophonus phytopathogenicus]